MDTTAGESGAFLLDVGDLSPAEIGSLERSALAMAIRRVMPGPGTDDSDVAAFQNYISAPPQPAPAR
jgi:FXSXX-COOH protein